MKKFLLLVSTTLLLQTANARQWIIFYAYPRGTPVPSGESPAGHAFAAFVKEDPALRQTRIMACWGFHPTKDGNGIFRSTSGIIKDDSKYLFSNGFPVEVTSSEYTAALDVAARWNTQRYWLKGKNCVNFLREIAACIPELNIPGSLTLFPMSFINKLKDLNPRSGQVGGSDVPAASAPVESYRKDLVNAAIRFFRWYEQVWDRKKGAFNLVLDKSGKPYQEGNCPCKIDPNGSTQILNWLKQNGTVLAPEFSEKLKQLMLETDTKLKKVNTTVNAEAAVEDLYVRGINIFMTQDTPDFQKSGFYDPNAKWGINVLSDENAFVDTPNFGWDNKPTHFVLGFTKVNGQWLLNGSIVDIN